jgi:arylsulfatase
MAIDVLPTLAARAGAAVPTDRVIDGRDLWPWMKDAAHPGEPHEALFFYGGMTGSELHAVRAGTWKLHVPHPWLDVVAAHDGAAGKYVPQALPLSLYDLSTDPGEATSLAEANPDVVGALLAHIERARDDLGDALTGRTGKNVRAPRE